MKPILISILAVLLILLVLLKVTGNRLSEGFEGASKSVIICKAEWCGHCKKAAPEFQKLLGASPITLKDGSKATVKILDEAKDKAEISKYNVKGYPTILISEGGKVTEYPGERTAAGVMSFLNGGL
jgi:thiol-disulfide isomerase/thioredoxin